MLFELTMSISKCEKKICKIAKATRLKISFPLAAIIDEKNSISSVAYNSYRRRDIYFGCNSCIVIDEESSISVARNGVKYKLLFCVGNNPR